MATQGGAVVDIICGKEGVVDVGSCAKGAFDVLSRGEAIVHIVGRVG